MTSKLAVIAFIVLAAANAGLELFIEPVTEWVPYTSQTRNWPE
ncbi:MAG: hypothetical protein ACRC6I_18240 [Paracoccaceae bacterium]